MNKKIEIGKKVVNFDKSFIGTVTAILDKGNGVRDYQCSYLNRDGNPSIAFLAECELTVIDDVKRIGFGR